MKATGRHHVLQPEPTTTAVAGQRTKSTLIKQAQTRWGGERTKTNQPTKHGIESRLLAGETAADAQQNAPKQGHQEEQHQHRLLLLLLFLLHLSSCSQRIKETKKNLALINRHVSTSDDRKGVSANQSVPVLDPPSFPWIPVETECPRSGQNGAGTLRAAINVRLMGEKYDHNNSW